MLVSNHPEDAAEIVRRASNGEGLLSNDGASVGNLVSGDAVRSYITMATIKDKAQGLRPEQSFYSFFVSPDNYLHAHRPDPRRDHQGVRPGRRAAPGRHRARRCIAACPTPSPGRRRTSCCGRSRPRWSWRRCTTARRSSTSTTPTTTRSPITPGPSGPRPSTPSTASTRLLRPLEKAVARRAPAVPLHRPLRPRPEPRRDLPAALRQDAPGGHRASSWAASTACRTATGEVEEWGPLNAFLSEAAPGRARPAR